MVSVIAEPRQDVTLPSGPPVRRDRLAIPLLVLASGISQTGNALTALVIPWFVYVTTGSAARTGLVAFFLREGPVRVRLGGGRPSARSALHACCE